MSELDLRLAAGAAAAWIAVLCCRGARPGAIVAVGTAAAVSALLLMLAGRLLPWFGRCSRVAALALFAVVLVVMPMAGRLAQARASPLMRLARQHAPVVASLTVSEDPRSLAAKGVAGAPRIAVVSKLDGVVAAGAHVGGAGGGLDVLVLAPARGWAGVLPGQRVRVSGVLQPSLDDALSVTLFVTDPPVRLGSPPWWQRAAGAVRSALRRASDVLPDADRGLLPGLVDGDTSHLDPVLAERFRLAGLTHLVAVSGTNCSVVLGAVLLLLRRARARPWISALTGATVLVAFVVVARPSPSVVRAAAMAGIALVALALGRPRAALPALAAAVLGLLAWDARLAADPSFTMSVLATTALLTIAPGWAAALRRHGVPVGVAETVAVAAAAHLVTAPVVAAIAGRVSLVAVPANVLAEPVVAVTTVLGFAAALVAPLWLGAGSALAWLAGWPCRWLVGVASFFGGLHGATLPWPGGVPGGLWLLAVLALLGLLLTLRRTRPFVAVAAVVGMLVQIPVRSVVSAWPPSGWVFVACDIGQGDALVLNAAPHAAVVVDTGPEPVATDRCLRDLGVSDIPILFLTHFHLDHVGGISGAMRGRRVGRVETGPLYEPASGVGLVRDALRSRGLGMSSPAVGASFDVGALRLDVLGPAALFHDTHSDPNNSSLVMRATVAGIRILLSGDAEIEAQRALLDSGVDLRADVLKVWHHGSAYFDPAYVTAVRARTAVISVGLHNDYGHPSPLALAALARAGVPVSRTDLDGDVAVTVRDGQLATVRRGTAASTLGLRGARLAPEQVTSGVDARMPECQPVRSPPAICRARCPAPSCWSATRSFWSIARSARSPPPSGPSSPT